MTGCLPNMSTHRRATALALAGQALPVLTAALLLLPSLGNGMLWRDEAETACLARSVVRYGVPLARNGPNLVTTEAGRDIGPGGDYVLSPPGQTYVAALSFAVFGPSTWSARLPFAVMSLLTLCLYIRLCRRFCSRWGAPLAVWALVLCVPFYLYSRQCRYYACSMFSGVAMAYCYLQSEKLGWRLKSLAFTGFVGALLFAWYCHLVTFAVLSASVASYALLKGQGSLRARVIWLLAGAAIVAAGALPWVKHARMLGWVGSVRWLSWEGPAQAVTVYLNSVASVFLLPILAIWLTGHLLVPGYGGFVVRSPLFRLVCWVVMTGSVVFVGLGSLRLTWPWGRYLCGLVPLYAVIAGELLAPLWRASKAAGLVLMLACLTTSLPCWILFAGVPAESPIHRWNPTYKTGVRVWLADHVASLVFPYRGPLEGIVGYIAPRAREGDAGFIEFEAEALMFYTNLEVLRELPFPKPPRWVVLRPQGAENAMFTIVKGMTINPAARRRHFPTWWHTGVEDVRGAPLANREYVMRYVLRNKYRKIVLPHRDWGMENYPELIGHKFTSDEADHSAALVTIYERTR